MTSVVELGAGELGGGGVCEGKGLRGPASSSSPILSTAAKSPPVAGMDVDSLELEADKRGTKCGPSSESMMDVESDAPPFEGVCAKQKQLKQEHKGPGQSSSELGVDFDRSSLRLAFDTTPARRCTAPLSRYSTDDDSDVSFAEDEPDLAMLEMEQWERKRADVSWRWDWLSMQMEELSHIHAQLGGEDPIMSAAVKECRRIARGDVTAAHEKAEGDARKLNAVEDAAEDAAEDATSGTDLPRPMASGFPPPHFADHDDGEDDDEVERVSKSAMFDPDAMRYYAPAGAFPATPNTTVSAAPVPKRANPRLLDEAMTHPLYSFHERKRRRVERALKVELKSASRVLKNGVARPPSSTSRSARKRRPDTRRDRRDRGDRGKRRSFGQKSSSGAVGASPSMRVDDYDINDVIIPFGVGTVTKIRVIEYKEIYTPQCRKVENYELAPDVQLQQYLQDHAQVHSGYESSESEDTSDERYLALHARPELEERRRFHLPGQSNERVSRSTHALPSGEQAKQHNAAAVGDGKRNRHPSKERVQRSGSRESVGKRGPRQEGKQQRNGAEHETCGKGGGGKTIKNSSNGKGSSSRGKRRGGRARGAKDLGKHQSKMRAERIEREHKSGDAMEVENLENEVPGVGAAVRMPIPRALGDSFPESFLVTSREINSSADLIILESPATPGRVRIDEGDGRNSLRISGGCVGVKRKREPECDVPAVDVDILCGAETESESDTDALVDTEATGKAAEARREHVNGEPQVFLHFGEIIRSAREAASEARRKLREARRKKTATNKSGTTPWAADDENITNGFGLKNPRYPYYEYAEWEVSDARASNGVIRLKKNVF